LKIKKNWDLWQRHVYDLISNIDESFKKLQD
jgi:hypothetical protein